MVYLYHNIYNNVYLLTNKPQSVIIFYNIYMIILPNRNYVQFIKNISSFSYVGTHLRYIHI